MVPEVCSKPQIFMRVNLAAPEGKRPRHAPPGKKGTGKRKREDDLQEEMPGLRQKRKWSNGGVSDLLL
jgi:hypothetical protein